MRRRTVSSEHPIDLVLTLSPLRHGPLDPTIRLDRRMSCRATRTPEGPATVRFTASEDSVEVEAWGPGATWTLETAPDLLGIHDDPSGFHPPHPSVARLHRRLRGMRLGRSLAVVETIVPTIVEQKVTSIEAHKSWRQLVGAYGEPAPGGLGLRLPPDPAVLADLPYHAFHPFGIERKRADVIRGACSYAARLEETVSLPPEKARRRLLALTGVGPWTVANVETTAYGNPDAVVVGDYHLPHLVSWVLAGEARSTDARMIELLEPYAGHRARAVRLIAAGGDRPPRRHPHRRLRSIAAI